MSCLDRQLRDSFFMYFPFCRKTCIHTVNIFSKFATSENANLKNYVLEAFLVVHSFGNRLNMELIFQIDEDKNETRPFRLQESVILRNG